MECQILVPGKKKQLPVDIIKLIIIEMIIVEQCMPYVSYSNIRDIRS